MKNQGVFTISLDFELLWGVRDKRTIESYGREIKAVHQVLPEMLELFRKYHIKATLATVGLLFARSKEEMISFCPEQKPQYKDPNLSPYNGHFDLVKETPESDPYHFAPDLIRLIQEKFPEHEIGTHTFSHYYCQEEGQTVADFEADIQAAVSIAEQYDIQLQSIVFPRNQYNQEYLGVCKKYGITHYRGNEKAWYYAPQSETGTSLMKRVFRTADCYINLSGHNTYSPEGLCESGMVDVCSSRFYRPFNRKGGVMLEALKIHRIKKSMTHAAKKGELFHLWWHPHNFSQNKKRNFQSLEKILNHYTMLQKKFGFETKTMKDC